MEAGKRMNFGCGRRAGLSDSGSTGLGAVATAPEPAPSRARQPDSLLWLFDLVGRDAYALALALLGDEGRSSMAVERAFRRLHAEQVGRAGSSPDVRRVEQRALVLTLSEVRRLRPSA